MLAVDFINVLILLRKVRNCRKSGVAITTDAKVWKNEIGCKCPQHVTDRKRGTRESTQPVRDGSAGKPAENYGNIPPLWAGVRPRVLLAADGVNRRETSIADGRGSGRVYAARRCVRLRIHPPALCDVRHTIGAIFRPRPSRPSGRVCAGNVIEAARKRVRHASSCGNGGRGALQRRRGRGQRISARRCKP